MINQHIKNQFIRTLQNPKYKLKQSTFLSTWNISSKGKKSKYFTLEGCFLFGLF